MTDPGAIALYDPGRFGHHEVMLPAIIDTLAARGRDVVAFGPVDGPAEATARASERARFEPVGPGSSDPPPLAEIAVAAAAAGARVLWHLDAGIELERAAPGRLALPALFIVHRPRLLTWRRVSSLRVDRQLPRIRRRRAALHGLGESGRVVVHTVEAAREVAGLVDDDPAVVPVPILPPAGGVGDRAPDPERLLWIGALRADKGAPLLPGALDRLDGAPSLEIVGVGRNAVDGVVEALRARRTIWSVSPEGSLDWSAMEAAYRRAALVLAPYPPSPELLGVAPTVHLEALARGVPVVVGRGLAEQLPPDRLGCVVTEGDDEAALASAIDRARGRIDELAEEARRAAAWVAAEHGYAIYVTALEELTARLG